MHIVAFAASTSRKSLNKQLVTYAAHLAAREVVPDATVDILDLNDFEMPIYSIDRQTEDGFPAEAQNFRDRINGADALIISFAEHNGSYAAAYKNIFDWASRMEGKVYQDKPVVLLATSPGPRGGASVLEQSKTSMPFFGASVLSSLSVPSFNEVFDTEQGMLTDETLHDALLEALKPLADIPAQD